jgi:hypothetical protein
MGRIVTIAAAIVVLTASWVSAGSFQTLADAAAVRPPTPLHIQPGSAANIELMSMKTDSDVEAESALPVTTRVAAAVSPQVKPRPAVAFRDRKTGSMAPPPRMNSEVEGSGGMIAEARDEDSSLESDLEKDLVIERPPAKTEEPPVAAPKPKVEKKASELVPAVSGVRAEKKKATPQVKQMSPDVQHYATNGKPIRKVQPVTQSQWSFPAGSYDARLAKPDRATHERRMKPRPPRMAAADPRAAQYGPFGSQPQGYDNGYMGSEPRRALMPPPTADRFVRDGVTIKLAPNAPAPSPDEYQDEAGNDLLGAAAEIIGLPFAFISSLF